MVDIKYLLSGIVIFVLGVLSVLLKENFISFIFGILSTFLLMKSVYVPTIKTITEKLKLARKGYYKQ